MNPSGLWHLRPSTHPRSWPGYRSHTAEYTDGVLTLTIPVAETAKLRSRVRHGSIHHRRHDRPEARSVQVAPGGSSEVQIDVSAGSFIRDRPSVRQVSQKSDDDGDRKAPGALRRLDSAVP